MKKELENIIMSDLNRYEGVKSKKKILVNFIKNPGFRYTFYLRKSQFYKKNWFIRNYYKHILKKMRYKYGFEIPHELSLGKGFYIGHFGGITINGNTIIGDNVNISKGITIGQSNRGYKKGCPTIGDKVWIGSNAVIVGKISIGSNVLIAPNSYVNFNVPDNSVVIGNPAKIKNKEDATLNYINNIS